MRVDKLKLRPAVIVTVLVLLLTGSSVLLADQITMSYVDADGASQTILLDCNTSDADLALAASLAGDDGVSMVNDADAGCGTVAEIAAKLAAASLVHAASVAEAFAETFPDQKDAIVAAINAVSGVDTTAVLAAVHLGPPGTFLIDPDARGDLDLIKQEQVPSKN